MRYVIVLSALLLVIGNLDLSSATSEPVCGYQNAEGETKFLKYFPHAKRGEEYVDFGADGRCVKKATCQADYTLKIDDCASVKISCENRNLFSDSVFPKCCIKC